MVLVACSKQQPEPAQPQKFTKQEQQEPEENVHKAPPPLYGNKIVKN